MDKVGDYLFDEELVLLGEDGAPFGDRYRDVAYLVSGRVWVNNHMHVLRPFPSVDARFLTYALNSVDWLRYISGSTRDKLTQEDMWRVTIANIGYNDQRAVADFLDAETARTDALIAKRRQMLRILNERRMAVTIGGVSGRFTSCGQRLSTLPWLDSLGADWPAVKLTLVARLGSGHTPSRSHPEWWVDPTIPWVTTGEVAQMRSDRLEFITETREFISELGLANSSAEKHPSGSVVLCRTASAGYSAIMGGVMSTSQDFAVWTCTPLLRPRFLLLCLRAMRQDLLGRLAMGSTHKTIYMPDIESLRIPLPPVIEQDHIVDAVWSRLKLIDVTADGLQRQIGLLVERRQALITAAVRGDLQVPGLAA